MVPKTIHLCWFSNDPFPVEIKVCINTWKRLLPEDRQLYYNRIIQFTSHSTLSNEVVSEPSGPEKQTVKLLLEHLVNSKYWKEEIAVEPVAAAETEEASI